VGTPNIIQDGDRDRLWLVDLYVDNYIGLPIPQSHDHFQIAANVVMHDIHDVFPAHTLATTTPSPTRRSKKEVAFGCWSRTFWVSCLMGKARYCG
jgi:hypothetical protein